ncbi:MAG: imelysin family protein, partial [Chloroflexota bacterium]
GALPDQATNSYANPQPTEEVTVPTAVPTPAPTVDAANFTRQAMLQDIGYGVIMPLHERFVGETAVLRDAVYAFEAAPSEATLADVQATWKIAAATWKQAEALDFDGLQFGRVYNWPAETVFVERLIAEPSYMIDETFILTRGSFAQGLPIIEYFVFHPQLSQAEIVEGLMTHDLSERRFTYLLTAADLLHNTAVRLHQFWLPEGQNQIGVFVMADEAPIEPEGSINGLANKMLKSLEDIREMKVASPAGFLDPNVAPGYVEAPFSGQSADHLVQNLRGWQQLFNGGVGYGYDDYLDFLDANYGEEQLSDVINAQIETAVSAVEQIEQPLETAVVDNPQAVLRVYEELSTLVRLTKTDMANHLGLLITYNDGDGD